MKTTFIIVLIACAFATNTALFERIENSDLGKTLLNTIAI
jgi:predicted outer membrane lipoprotein